MALENFKPEMAQKAFEGNFPGDLGIEILTVEPNEVTGRMAVDSRHLHPGGYVHGGAWVAFADTVAAWGTMRNIADGDSFTTSEMKVNVFGAGLPGDVLTATGMPLHIGSRTQVWEVRVFKNQNLAANFICTQMILSGVINTVPDHD